MFDSPAKPTGGTFTVQMGERTLGPFGHDEVDRANAAIAAEPRYHYEEAYHETRDRLRGNSGFIIALAVNSAISIPTIGAVLGVTAECINRRLRAGGLTRPAHRPTGRRSSESQPRARTSMPACR